MGGKERRTTTIIVVNIYGVLTMHRHQSKHLAYMNKFFPCGNVDIVTIVILFMKKHALLLVICYQVERATCLKSYQGVSRMLRGR